VTTTPYYQDEAVTLYHGDCREVTAWLKADVLVTDPPYGYGHRSGGGPRGSASWKNTTIANDEDTTARDDVLTMWGDRPALLFGSWKRPRPAATRAMLIWDKGGHAGMGDLTIPWKPNFEEVYVIGSGFTGSRDSGVLAGHHVPANEAAGRTHPHEKPLSLMCALIAKAPGVIADPFAGSGTTLHAARQLGRKAIGVELEERYCEVIAKRLAQGVLDFGEASA
jgi:site-specific DNA-methyltransferase (adenine-specific)